MERLRIIRSPNQRMRIEQKYPATYILSVWIFAFLVTIPPILGWGKYSIEGTGVSCSVDWESTTLNSLTYIAFLFVIGFLVPVIVIVSSYAGVCITLHQVKSRFVFFKLNFSENVCNGSREYLKLINRPKLNCLLLVQLE